MLYSGRSVALYRHFDAAGQLLYVGISLSAVARLAQHMNASSWADEIASMTVTRYATREEAHDAEREAIRSENPKHNLLRYALKLEVEDPAPDDVEPVVDEEVAQIERDAERARYELLRGAVAYKPIYSTGEAAKALSIYEPNLIHWMTTGECGHVVLGKMIRNYPPQDGTPHVYRTIGMTGWQLIDLVEILQRQALTGKSLLSDRPLDRDKPTLLREPVSALHPALATGANP